MRGRPGFRSHSSLNFSKRHAPRPSRSSARRPGAGTACSERPAHERVAMKCQGSQPLRAQKRGLATSGPHCQRQARPRAQPLRALPAEGAAQPSPPGGGLRACRCQRLPARLVPPRRSGHSNGHRHRRRCPRTSQPHRPGRQRRLQRKGTARFTVDLDEDAVAVQLFTSWPVVARSRRACERRR